MLNEIFLVATETAAKTPGANGAAPQAGSPLGLILIYAVILGGMYLLLLRPNNKKKKEEEKLRREAEIGDEIITIGGIVGRIVSIKEDTDTIVIETGADRVKIRIQRWAIGSNPSQEERIKAGNAAVSANKKGFLDKLNEKMEKKAQEKEKNK